MNYVTVYYQYNQIIVYMEHIWINENIISDIYCKLPSAISYQRKAREIRVALSNYKVTWAITGFELLKAHLSPCDFPTFSLGSPR